MMGLGTTPSAGLLRGWATCTVKLLAAGLVVLLNGCAAAGLGVGPSDEQRAMTALASKVQALEYQLLATQVAISGLSGEQQTTQQTLTDRLTDLHGRVEGLPAAVASVCIPSSGANPRTEAEQPAPVVVMNGDKMVVGELERVWIEPPGANLIARVDTGADSSSLHAENLVEFERDGDDWVRFDVILNDAVTSLERPVARYARVYQQADVEGTRRPVVALRLRLGDVRDTFEFTLADRSHLDFQMLLGRNFLSDLALVDVGKQFVQPPFKPKKNN